MPERLVLAVDLGTGGPKVALATVTGVIVDHEYRRTSTVLLPDGGAEQDPEEWWRTIRDAARTLAERRPAEMSNVVAVAITSQWMGTVAVDAAGRALGNALIWMDSRGAPHSERLVGGGLEVPGTGYNAGRLLRWIRLTGGAPSRTGKDPVGHIAFLRHERPDVYAEARHFLEPMDYLTLRLTGRTTASFASITGYWCTDNRDLSRVHYDDTLLRWTGLERRTLPELVPTGSVLGPLLPAVAAELGLPASAQVVTSLGDTASAGIGAGAVRLHDAHLYIGTSSWLSCHTRAKRTDLGATVAALPSGIPDRYWVATEQEAAGKCLAWLSENVLFAEDSLGTSGAPEDVFERLGGLAESVAAGSDGVLFLPWLNGEKTPVDDHRIRGGFLNVSLRTSRATLVRSVLEGVALNTRWMLEAAERFVRKEHPGGFPTLRFVGGGARSALWCQILADVTGKRILVPEAPVLANVRGAALAAAVSLGDLRFEDVPARVPITATYEPHPAEQAVYERRFATFLAAYRATRGLFEAETR